MLNKADWLDQAKALPLNGTARVTHSCGPGQVLKIGHSPSGYSAYCFRCAEPGFEAHGEVPLAERLARMRAWQAAAEASASPDLPRPAVHDLTLWPTEARVWLYKAGLSNKDIASLGLYWHDGMGRVVIPVRHKDQLVMWQGRAVFPGQVPKYLNQRASKSGYAEFGDGPTVLVEDYLSAYRVGHVAHAFAVLGTSLGDRLLARLLSDGLPVLVWLDPDPPGLAAAERIVRQLRAYGLQAKRVVSRKDPKLLSKEEIWQHVSESNTAHPTGRT